MEALLRLLIIHVLLRVALLLEALLGLLIIHVLLRIALLLEALLRLLIIHVLLRVALLLEALLRLLIIHVLLTVAHCRAAGKALIKARVRLSISHSAVVHAASEGVFQLVCFHFIAVVSFAVAAVGTNAAQLKPDLAEIRGVHKYYNVEFVVEAVARRIVGYALSLRVGAVFLAAVFINVKANVADLRKRDQIRVFLTEITLSADNELARRQIDIDLGAAASVAFGRVEAVELSTVLLAVFKLLLDLCDGGMLPLVEKRRKLLFAVCADIAVLELAEGEHTHLAAADIADFLIKQSHISNLLCYFDMYIIHEKILFVQRFFKKNKNGLPERAVRR